MRCKECEALLSQRALPDFRGECEDVVVAISGLKALRCETEGHAVYWPYPDFEADLLDAIFSKGSFPVAQQKGWWRPRLACRRCDKPIDGAEPEIASVKGRIWLERVSPFVLEIRAEALRCVPCRAHHILPGEVQEERIQRALVRAFASIGLGHTTLEKPF